MTIRRGGCCVSTDGELKILKEFNPLKNILNSKPDSRGTRPRIDDMEGFVLNQTVAGSVAENDDTEGLLLCLN